MKSLLFSLLAVLLLAAAGCRSSKSVAPVPVPADEQWSNIYLPVKLEMLQPKQMAVSGRVTMVRDSSVYFSFRIIGMEVASAYCDADSAFVAMKHNRTLLTAPLRGLLSGASLTVGDIQDLLLGEGRIPAKAAGRISYAVDDVDDGSTRIVTLKTIGTRQPVEARLTWSMAEAEYDVTSPRMWRKPGGYRRVPVAELAAGLNKYL